jgi:hypothetical protein
MNAVDGGRSQKALVAIPFGEKCLDFEHLNRLHRRLE